MKTEHRHLDPNEPAYPMREPTSSDNYGLSVRAEFAKAALQGLLANPLVLEVQCDHEITERATKLADLLLIALNQPAQP